MKKYFIILACITMCFACKTRTDDPGKKDIEINNAAVVSMDVSIKGMTCTGCENSIKSGVSEIPGVVDVTASFQEGKARIKYDTTLTDLEKISMVIGKRGYEVTAALELSDQSE